MPLNAQAAHSTRPPRSLASRKGSVLAESPREVYAAACSSRLLSRETAIARGLLDSSQASAGSPVSPTAWWLRGDTGAPGARERRIGMMALEPVLERSPPAPWRRHGWHRSRKGGVLTPKRRDTFAVDARPGSTRCRTPPRLAARRRRSAGRRHDGAQVKRAGEDGCAGSASPRSRHGGEPSRPGRDRLSQPCALARESDELRDCCRGLWPGHKRDVVPQRRCLHWNVAHAG